ncbi:unnamed protein product [Mycena citricolor]|uniref:Uncharacterized protein n=1 Tax=Mycena citricolor TaxID=2018698 RepID=A0AAD2H648_9AGAR|nr:unnamed protein product [Mycena citricolor]
MCLKTTAISNSRLLNLGMRVFHKPKNAIHCIDLDWKQGQAKAWSFESEEPCQKIQQLALTWPSCAYSPRFPLPYHRLQLTPLPRHACVSKSWQSGLSRPGHD